MTGIVDLTGKRGLVVGIANDHSIAAGRHPGVRAQSIAPFMAAEMERHQEPSTP